MIGAFFGLKLDTSQTFDDKGNRLVVSRIQTPPMTVTRLKTLQKDGYWAVQVAVNKKLFRELRFSQQPDLKVGDLIKLDQVFQVGDKVKVSGLSKGRGFAGVIKRWGFAGGPRTHGQSDRERAPGSIGQRTDPGRVWKGKKMPGHFGQTTISVKNLKVVAVDAANNILQVSGTIPGSRRTLVKITKINKK
jgi:large subunit ribosomal protein L3